MPRLSPVFLHECGRKYHPFIKLLLPEVRDVLRARQELRWLSEYVDARFPPAPEVEDLGWEGGGEQADAEYKGGGDGKVWLHGGSGEGPPIPRLGGGRGRRMRLKLQEGKKQQRAAVASSEMAKQEASPDSHIHVSVLSSFYEQQPRSHPPPPATPSHLGTLIMAPSTYTDERTKFLKHICYRRGILAEPIQYITGYEYFGHLCLFTEKGVLIPRQDTADWVQHLCKQLLRHLNPYDGLQQKKGGGHLPRHRPLRILDFCSGSGCIPLLIHSLLYPASPPSPLLIAQESTKNSRLPFYIPYLVPPKILGIDISQQAISLSNRNLIQNVFDTAQGKVHSAAITGKPAWGTEVDPEMGELPRWDFTGRGGGYGSLRKLGLNMKTEGEGGQNEDMVLNPTVKFVKGDLFDLERMNPKGKKLFAKIKDCFETPLTGDTSATPLPSPSLSSSSTPPASPAKIPIDIIVSNPPYISPTSYSSPSTSRSVRRHEPKLALVPPSPSTSLDSSVDPGSTFYPTLSRLSSNPSLFNAKALLVEISSEEEQHATVVSVMKKDWKYVATWCDYAGRQRVVVGWRDLTEEERGEEGGRFGSEGSWRWLGENLPWREGGGGKGDGTRIWAGEML